MKQTGPFASATWEREDINLVECAGVVKAKIVVTQSGNTTFGHLWLAGRVIVAHTPEEPGEGPCWYTFRDGANAPYAQIDPTGSFTMRGLLYVNNAPALKVYNFPFKIGGTEFYGW